MNWHMLESCALHVAPGNLIFTDEYNIYERLPLWGYTQKTVNKNLKIQGKQRLHSLLELLVGKTYRIQTNPKHIKS